MDDQNVSEGTQSRGHYFALSAGSKLNEFEIVSVLGHGGFGITYLAKDTLLDEQVALKEFFPNELAVRITDQTVRAKSDDEDSDFQSGLNAFLGEARLLARFRKLNIVHVRRFFEMHGTGYIVQDYEQGETLSKRLDKGPVEEAELRHLLEGVLNGLETVHERGILHRDLKPDNIIIRADGTPVLIDFGAARDFTVRQSRTVTAIASGSYTPPEQWGAGEQPGPWSDLYSLGAVAYRCVTGNPPPMALKRLGKDPMVPAVTAGQGRYDAALLRCIDWMLEVDESKRPLSVQMVQQALDGKGPASVPGARSSTKLKRVGALVAGLALAGALIGGGYVLYGQWQLRSLNQQLTAKLTAAGYDKTALTSFLSQCGSTCPEDLHKEAQAKLDTVATEAQQYQSAGDDPAKLRSYASTCKACLAKTEALKRASDIEAKAATVAAMTKKLAKAGYDKTALTSFLSQCGDTCPDDLRKEAQAKLDTVATEAQQYQSAGDDPAKLRSYASTCKACLAKTEALDRVTAIEEQAAKLQDAGYDKTALTSFLSQCGDTCPDDLRKEAQAKLDLIAAEEHEYRAASSDPDKLRQYASTCQACIFKNQALSDAAAVTTSPIGATLAPQPALPPVHSLPQAPVFPCEAAHTPAEVTICNSSVLAGLDVQLNASYAQAVANNPSLVKSQQRAWLKQRDACGTDGACIEHQYRQQIGWLQSVSVPTGRSQGPSFSCARAHLAAEVAICNSAVLINLDAELNDLYARAKSSTQSRYYIDKQRAWLRRRNACGGSTSCLEHCYQEQISFLQGAH